MSREKMTIKILSPIGKEIEKCKIKKKEKIINRIGLILVILISVGCIFFINVLSADFDTSLTSQWLLTFCFSFLQDMLIGQPIKCLLIMGILFFCSSPKIKSGTDQCLRIFANFVATKLLSSAQ